MKKLVNCLIVAALGFCFACQTGKQAFNPDKKYAPEALRKDYRLFRSILEESHPSLYWYTSPDSLQAYFDGGYARITDSMTLPAFRTLLSYTISKINCGHTSVRYSKAFNRYLDTARLRLFPLSVKLWKDTMVVTANINRRDSVLRRGVVIKSINGLSQTTIRDSLFNYLVTDGYSLTGKYQTLSSDFGFGAWYKNVFGLPDQLDIHYLDSAGQEKQVSVPVYDPASDTARFRHLSQPRGPGEKKVLKRPNFEVSMVRNLQVDTAGSTGFMTVSTFSRGYQLKRFFRRSFRTLRENHIRDLVIDVRSNGGGEASNSTLLTRYLIDRKFKIADSLYAVNRHSRHYDKYIGNSLLYRTMMLFVTKKHRDGKYHFGYFERHYFKPKNKDHFDGQVYVLIGGNSFSATTLFAGSLKGQKNVTMVGEETGGGSYGNSAWMIPEVTLPNTGLRFRLPKFHLVVNRNWVKDGHGVMPDVPALPTTTAIKQGIDFKAEKARELILSHSAQKP